MDTERMERLEKLLLRVLMNQAMIRAEVAELNAQLGNTAAVVDGAARLESYRGEMSLLKVLMMAEGLDHHWDWLVRSHFPEQAG